MATTDSRHRGPVLNFNFLVQIEGVQISGFCYIDGFESSVDVLLRRQNRRQDSQKVPGKKHFKNIILRRGFDQTLDLWKWYQDTISGNMDKRNGTISILNEDKAPIMRFEFQDAWPCRWQLSPLNALNPDVLIEEIELVIKSFDIT